MNVLASRSGTSLTDLPMSTALPEKKVRSSDLEQVAKCFRTMQLCAHNAHNLTKGSSFFGDHKFLGHLYGEYESAYDSAVERMIGRGIPVNLVNLQKEAASALSESFDYFHALQMEEVALVATLEMAIKNETSQGTINMLAGMADDSEVRQYKLRQRLGF